MNQQERAELERLKRRLESLRHEFDLLWMQTQQLEARLDLPAEAFEETGLSETAVQETSHAPTVPLPAEHLEVTARSAGPATPATPPPLPPVITPQPAAAFADEETPTQTEPHLAEAEGSDAASPSGAPAFHAEGAPTPAKDSSFEMKLGRVWFVRVGIVMVLTGMVFLGNLAYQKLDSLGKVALLYLVSGVLLGLGAWLQRRQESLKNYAQVLFAGGLAAVYFTTYAAHHIESLRVISSPRLDGLLLLAWAGFMVWMADRKKSELLALFAVGLAYYTSIITNIGLFTLYSNLVLTAAGVFFFVRNRWTTLSFGSLLATYGGYSYWRFYVDGQWLWHLNLSTTDFQLGNLFLLGYWLLFTAAVFLSRHEKFAGEPRAAFLTINNAAFFSLVVLARWFVDSGSFWKFSLCFGAVLLGLAALAARTLSGEKIVVNSYLTQGLVLVTLGFMTYFTGLKLALVLAAESVILLILAYQRQNLLLHVASCIVALLAVGWGVTSMKSFDRAGLWLGSSVGALMAFNSFWSRRSESGESGDEIISPRAAFFSALALATWIVTTWNNTTRENLPLVLAAETVLLTASIYLLRVPEMALLGQLNLVLAQTSWLFETWQQHPDRPWWNPALLIGITLGLSHWWQRQFRLKVGANGVLLLQGVYALAAVGVLFFWLQPIFKAPVWLAFTGILAIAFTIYGVVTRAWPLAVCGQVFLVASGWEFFSQIFAPGKPSWYLALTPMASLAVLSFGTVQWLERRPGAKAFCGETVLPIALLYRWVALLMSLAWVYEYIPARERVWVLTVAGALVFWEAGWRKNREGLMFGAVWTAAGFWLFWFPFQGEPTVYLPNLLAILLLLGQQQLARRLPEHYEFNEGLHTAMILLGGLSLWRYVSKWVVLLQSEGFYLTVAWAVLALLLLVAGLLLRERMYRWLGLGVLACALGHVVIFDVWKLETLYRILSFMALGVVLLVLGFIYNRYQERIKEWL